MNEHLNPDQEQLLSILLTELDHGDRQLFDGLSWHEKEQVLTILREFQDKGASASYDVLWELDYREKPVDITTFMEDRYYSGEFGSGLYDKWRDELRTVLGTGSKIVEWCLTGPIGGGKTTAATFGEFYKLYQMCCMRDPFKFYDLMGGGKLVWGFFTRTLELSDKQGYGKIRNFIRGSPWFRERYLVKIGGREKIELPHNIVVVGGSQMEHALGQDVYSYQIDEANFMNTKDNSEEEGQAYKLYSATQRRLKTRFMERGHIPGLVTLISSKQSVNAFLEKHIAQAKGDLNVHVSDFPSWMLKPSKKFTGVWFPVEVGNAYRSSRIIPDVLVKSTDTPTTSSLPTDLELSEGTKIVFVPQEYRKDFERDINGALRDIAGVATWAVSPLIWRPEAISECVCADYENPFTSPEISISTDWDKEIESWLKVDDIFEIKHSNWIPKYNSLAPRYVHVDLARTGDSAAIAVGHVRYYRQTKHESPDGSITTHTAPVIRIDMLVRINPPHVGEIDFEKIRRFILKLDGMGMKLRRISFDGYQSADSIQLLRKMGWDATKATRGMPIKKDYARHAEVLSIDKSDLAYTYVRNSILEHRLEYPRHDVLIEELTRLEHNIEAQKVDHPDGGSKDLSDSVAGVVYWAMTLKSEYARVIAEDEEQIIGMVAAVRSSSEAAAAVNKHEADTLVRWDITQDYRDRKRLSAMQGPGGNFMPPPQVKSRDG